MARLLRLFMFVFVVGLFALVLIALNSTPGVANAQHGVPLNDAKRGLIYDGLGTDAACKSGFKINLPGQAKGKVPCTHGPDAAPTKMNVAMSVDPIIAPAISPSSKVQCDGDGVSGPRVQLIYAHASDMPDRYATFQSSFPLWMGDTDAIYQNSAALTGGSRHIRFVTDANCNLVVPDLTLSPAGDDTFSDTVTEVQNQGFNRSDRKYIMFVDSNVYCGLGTIMTDDQPGFANANNLYGSWARVDSGCWSGIIAAHELTHMLGGVQLTAPHSSGDYHCTDAYDLMCRPTNGVPVQIICPDSSNLDCDQDDYFNANPPAGNYLATHWNTANSIFLIGAPSPQPTATPTATATPIPPTATATPIPPTATPRPSATPIPPTATPRPSATPIPPTATPRPSATPTRRIVPPMPSPTAAPAQSIRVDSVVTGKASGKTFTATDTFKPGEAVVVRIHVRDQNQENLKGVSVSFTITMGDGRVQCTLSDKTDASGNAEDSCTIPRNPAKGSWKVQVNQVNLKDYTFSAASSVTSHNFTVQ